MNINFKQPRYIMPLLALPFICLFFYVYHSGTTGKTAIAKHVSGMNSSVADVSPEVKKRKLEDKLDAYRNTFKESDGNTAVIPIPTESPSVPLPGSMRGSAQNKLSDSISRLVTKKYGTMAKRGRTANYKAPAISARDRELETALNNLTYRQNEKTKMQSLPQQEKEKDPMDVFRQEMAYMDSLRKSTDPAYQAEQQKQKATAKLQELKAREKTLEVQKADQPLADFNTVMPKKTNAFIMAIIDENVTGYAESRIRLRLLEDIRVGTTMVTKGTYIYALISGFSGQRVTLSIKSILYNNKMLPVKLDVFDLDGLQGLYVPDSQFRDFTKDLGTSTIQGVTIENNGSGSAASQLLMSTADKMFQSTSSAIAGAIRKNKAKIKYNSYIYLIDAHAQEKTAGSDVLASAD